MDFYFSAFDDYLGPEFILHPFCPELYLGNRCYGGKGFSSEPERPDGQQVMCSLYLRGGMPFETHPGVMFRHPAPVVDNLDQGLSGISYNHLDLG